MPFVMPLRQGYIRMVSHPFGASDVNLRKDIVLAGCTGHT